MEALYKKSAFPYFFSIYHSSKTQSGFVNHAVNLSLITEFGCEEIGIFLTALRIKRSWED